LVQGESGFYAGSHEFFKALMSILKDHGISVFIDEVQTFGRTPAMFAFQFFGLEEFVDIVSIGKLSHVCATLFKNNHKPRPGLLSQTFTSSTAAIRVSIVMLNHLANGGYYGAQGKIVKLHTYFEDKLQDLSKKYPKLISGPFGIGAMIAFTPYDGETHHVIKFVHALFEAGVISFIAGSNPTRCRFLVPAITTIADIDEVLKIIEKTLIKMK
jgi:4-aminobutyrate aminotransferase-like enzyme